MSSLASFMQLFDFGLRGFRIYESRSMGRAVAPPLPACRVAYRGPYKQRRIRNWHRTHPSYTVGDGRYFIVSGREIWCHPDDARRLRDEIELR
jgi:hypothetical protein